MPPWLVRALRACLAKCLMNIWEVCIVRSEAPKRRYACGFACGLGTCTGSLSSGVRTTRDTSAIATTAFHEGSLSIHWHRSSRSL